MLHFLKITSLTKLKFPISSKQIKILKLTNPSLEIIYMGFYMVFIQNKINLGSRTWFKITAMYVKLGLKIA